MPYYRLLVCSLLVVSVSLISAPRSTGEESASTNSKFRKETFVSDGGGQLKYRIYVPESAGDKANLPLVLFLHGAGERGNDNEAQLKHGVTEFLKQGRDKQFPAIVVAPQCPRDMRWVDASWSQADGEGTFMSSPTPTMKMVFELVDKIIAGGNVDPSCLYVTGLSMGGYGSWYAAAEYRVMASREVADAVTDPEHATTSGFAAMLAICGGGDTSWTDRYDPVSVWAVHGDADTSVPVGRSRAMICALVNGGHPGEIRYTELPGVSHDSWTQTYTDDETYRWLFSQKR